MDQIKLFLKKNKWIYPALVLMLILQFGVWYVKGGDWFDVTYSAGFDRLGYEPAPSEIYVYASREIKWDQAPAFSKIAGRIMWILIGVAFWFVGTDRVHGKRRATDTVGKRSPIEIVIAFAPVLLCLAFWFASYSASLAEGKIKQEFSSFKSEYKISDQLAADITSQKVKRIKDPNGLLTAHFTGK
jgi:hypothetical protein